MWWFWVVFFIVGTIDADIIVQGLSEKHNILLVQLFIHIPHLHLHIKKLRELNITLAIVIDSSFAQISRAAVV